MSAIELPCHGNSLCTVQTLIDQVPGFENFIQEHG